MSPVRQPPDRVPDIYTLFADLYNAPPCRCLSARHQPGQQHAHRVAPVRDLLLLAAGQLGQRLAGVGDEEDRVVAEAAGALRSVENDPLAGALGALELAARHREAQGADE